MNLGPNTEAKIASAFERTSLLGMKECCSLLGLSAYSIRKFIAADELSFTPNERGNVAFSEADVRWLFRPRRHPVVYFALSVGSLLVKIGRTNGTAARRVAQLQTGSAASLVLLASKRGPEGLEKKLHERFESSRHHGEWFVLSDDLRDYILKLRNGRAWT